MEAEFKIIFPKYDNSGNRINPERFNPYFNKIISEFDGFTLIPEALGCWRDEKSGKVMCDENMVVFTSADTSDQREINRKYNFLKQLSKDIGKEFGQASVFVENDAIYDVSFMKGKFKRGLGREEVLKVPYLERRIL